MRRVDITSFVKFMAFLATLASSFEEVGSNSSSSVDSTSSSYGKGNDKGLSRRVDSCSLVVVSTLDGKLSALDSNNNGKLKWSLPAFSGPLLSSSLGSFQTGKQVRVIPSLDGGLYKVAGDKIESIPYTADSLLGSFHKLQDGSMLVGGKEAISCGIDPQTGKVRYICSAEGCKLTEPEDSRHVQNKDIIVVKRTQQTVRAVDQRTGIERWNFSVGQQDVSFLEGITEGDIKCSIPDPEVLLEWSLRVSIPDGLIAAVQSQDSSDVASEIVLWSHKFESPIAAVWTLHGDYLQPVDLFSDETMPGLRDGLPEQGMERQPIIYLGSHEGQVYIQPSQPINSALDLAIKIHSQPNEAAARKPRAITWKPKLATSASRTPTIVSKEIAVWNPVEYPFDNGYYFCGDVQPIIPLHQRVMDNINDENKTLHESNAEKGVPNDITMEYWKGALAVIVVLGAVAQFFFRFLIPQRQQTQGPDNLQRLPSASISTSTGSIESVIQQAVSMSSSSSSLSSSNSFYSRYLTDFEHELCLGKGGFGLVFQARNKVDDCQYAIKRVRLPNCDEARAKVMREVKALAKLEHAGIVRYFNAWFEAPPVGWQEEFNEKLVEEGKYCGTGSESKYAESGISMHEILPDDDSCKQQSFSNDALYESSNMKMRRRKTASSGTTDNKDNRHNTLTADEDLSSPFDVHQLENETFLPEDEDSGSFGIEFAEESGSNVGLGNNINVSRQDLHVTNSGSSSIVFSNSYSNGVVSMDTVDNSHHSSDSLSSSASKSSPSLCFTTSGQSLLSGKHHRCGNKNCNSDALSTPLYLYIQMQLCQRESLKDWLKKNSVRDHAFCLNVFNEIIFAVEYFHGRGMMHRDLKPSNIFFSLDGSVKVGDFGLVTASVQDSTPEEPTEGKNGYVDANHTGQVGTQLYMSPEQIEGKAYSYKVDIFSLGLIFFELFHPFSTEMERIKVMSDVKMKVIPTEFEIKMSLQSQFVKWMLSDTPKSRPTATEIRSSDLFKNITNEVGQSSINSSQNDVTII